MIFPDRIRLPLIDRSLLEAQLSGGGRVRSGHVVAAILTDKEIVAALSAVALPTPDRLRLALTGARGIDPRPSPPTEMPSAYFERDRLWAIVTTTSSDEMPNVLQEVRVLRQLLEPEIRERLRSCGVNDEDLTAFIDLF